jgi:hypothetical protein
MQPDLFSKTAEEAVDILASRYVEVQTEKRASIKKAALSQEAAHALVGGAVGAGLGGLGSLGYNYLRGKKPKLRDALYGSLMGAVPGASLGYLMAPGEEDKKDTKNTDSNGGSGLLTAAAANTLIPGGAALAGARFMPGASSIVGKSPEQIRIAKDLKDALASTNPAIRNQIPTLQAALDRAGDTAKRLPERNILTNPLTGNALFGKNINANMARAGYRTAGGLGAAFTLHKLLGLFSSPSNEKPK